MAGNKGASGVATNAAAHALLDAARDGGSVASSAIRAALQTTGDIGRGAGMLVQRCRAVGTWERASLRRWGQVPGDFPRPPAGPFDGLVP